MPDSREKKIHLDEPANLPRKIHSLAFAFVDFGLQKARKQTKHYYSSKIPSCYF